MLYSCLKHFRKLPSPSTYNEVRAFKPVFHKQKDIELTVQDREWVQKYHSIMPVESLHLCAQDLSWRSAHSFAGHIQYASGELPTVDR